MRRIAGIGGLALAVCVVSAFGNDGSGRAAPRSETVRLQVRLDSVLAELSARDAGDLASARRVRRTQMIATLHAYRDRGLFPNNYDFPGQAVPYFVDRKTGVLCAVAYLMESTGRRDMVDRVAALDNNVWVPELARDTAFRSWLDANGLTLAEAARIQAPYVGDGNALPTNLPSFAQPRSQSRGMPAEPRRASAAPIAVVGVASLAATFISTRHFIKHKREVAAKKELERTRLSLAPTVSPAGGAGVTLSLKF